MKASPKQVSFSEENYFPLQQGIYHCLFFFPFAEFGQKYIEPFSISELLLITPKNFTVESHQTSTNHLTTSKAYAQSPDAFISFRKGSSMVAANCNAPTEPTDVPHSSEDGIAPYQNVPKEVYQKLLHLTVPMGTTGTLKLCRVK